MVCTTYIDDVASLRNLREYSTPLLFYYQLFAITRNADITDSFAVASSYGSPHTGKRVSKNTKHLAEVTVNSFFLENSMRFASNEELSFPQLQLYRLILTHLALDESARVPHCFEYSQKAVYGKFDASVNTCKLMLNKSLLGHPLDFPLFTDGQLKNKLNLNNLLHIV